MAIAVGALHSIETENEFTETGSIGDDLAKHIYRVRAQKGKPIRVTKLISYHTARKVPARELVDRCDRTLDREPGVIVPLTRSDCGRELLSPGDRASRRQLVERHRGLQSPAALGNPSRQRERALPP